MFEQKTASHALPDLPKMIFFVGVLLALMGGLNRFSTPSATEGSFAVTVSPSVIERKLSIEDALQNGQKTYQYQSRFIPGIGSIADPEAYLKELEKNSKQQP